MLNVNEFMQDDKLILTELHNGNVEAFKEAYKKYYVEMFQFAYSYLRSSNDAEDVVQDCFAMLLHKPQLWKNIADLRGYMFRMVQNQCLYQIRTKKSFFKKEEAYQYYEQAAPELDYIPEEVTPPRQEDRKEDLHWIFSVLSPKRKRALELVYLERKSYEKAAAEMGISKDSIKTHLRLAKLSVRGLIGALVLWGMMVVWG